MTLGSGSSKALLSILAKSSYLPITDGFSMHSAYFSSSRHQTIFSAKSFEENLILIVLVVSQTLISWKCPY